MTVARTQSTIPRLRGLPPLDFRANRLEFLLRVSRACGDMGSFRFGPYGMLLLNTSELVHSILVEHADVFEKGFAVQRAFRPVVGNGLFPSEGDSHRRQRKRMAPAFQPRHITSYADTMVRYGERPQAGWNDGESIDIGREMTRVTMSIVGKVLFDADVFTETDALGTAMTSALDHINYASTRLFPIPLHWPIPRHRRTRRALAFLKRRIQAMIDERLTCSEERDDLLTLLLRAREEDDTSMSDEQIRDEAVTLFGAGHETTATALTRAWYLLAAPSESSRKVLQEVDSVLHAYIPFGGGPRICLGNHFALMQGQLLLATLAQHVTFELQVGQHIEPEAVPTLRPKHGIRMTVRRRSGVLSADERQATGKQEEGTEMQNNSGDTDMDLDVARRVYDMKQAEQMICCICRVKEGLDV